MSKNNVVVNAKTAAKNVLTAVVDAVKPKTAGKDTPAPSVVSKPAKVTPVPTADASTPAVPKKKGKGKPKPVDLSVPRNGLKPSERKGLNKNVDPDSVTRATNTLGRGSNRAKVFGLSASSVWRALGYRKVGKEFVYTVSDAKGFRDGLGLGDVITDQNVKCQFSDGRGRANGNDPLYGGDVADLTADQWKTVDRMVKAAREA